MKWLKTVLIVSLLIAIAASLDSPIMNHITDSPWLVNYLAEQGATGHISLIAIGTVFIFIGGPRQAISLLFGFIYGLLPGIMLAISVCLVAAAANYFCASIMLKGLLARRFPQRMTKFKRFAKRKPFMKILMLRLLPVGSNLVTNFFSGSVGVPFLSFLAASAIGYLPQTIIFALVGGGINEDSPMMIYLSVILGLISLALTSAIYRDHTKAKMEQLKLESST
ncbi:TVP38/TMEM64 family protein [Motilimonas sp. KMU-193]|uniref:TVP38/TMEM64 family protein n=1 Tax=Motilimonas sp. KMU-193 TaxID=3388668 RepID=UPI00396B33C8